MATKWEGTNKVEVKSATADQVWPLLEDYCNFQKWLPTIDTCYKLEGEAGKPGVVRYCSTTIPLSLEGGDEKVTKFTKEKLVKIDPVQRFYTYQVLENNLGIPEARWEGTIQVLPVGDGKSGCEIHWTFAGDRSEVLTYEDMLAFYDNSLKGMAKKIEDSLN
ncbi:hypothetical protein UlMin_034858 [Ulmus minor]